MGFYAKPMWKSDSPWRFRPHLKNGLRPWVDEFVHFLTTHRGLGYESCRSARYFAQDFLSWRFKNGRVRWSLVSVEDLWSYAERCARQLKPRSANRGLSVLRRFLSFVQMRGACPLHLVQSVPHVATFGQSVRPEVLNGRQRRALLASFKRRTGGGCRDYTMALCMVDLGLRSIEVVRLRLSDIDWENRILSVPATRQTGGGNCLFRLISRRHCGPMFRCGRRLIATACLLAIVSELDSQFPPVRCEARCEPLIAVVLFPPVGLEPIVFAAPSRRGLCPRR